jgi:hypothetical protein
MPTTPHITGAAASAACAPVDSVASLNELYSHQLLCFCVARELHEAKAAMAEVSNLGVAAGLTQRVRVGWRLHPGAHGGACRTRKRSDMLAGNSLQEHLKPRMPQTMLGMVCGKLLLTCVETTRTKGVQAYAQEPALLLCLTSAMMGGATAPLLLLLW